MKWMFCLVMAGILMAGCSSGEMRIDVQSLAASDNTLYALADTYLNDSHVYKYVSADLDCTSSGDEGCLLRIEASDHETSGPSSSMILYVSTAAQELPGTVAMETVAQVYGVSPAIYAASEEVSREDVVVRYSFDCRYTSGELVLDDKPAVDAPISGHFDINMDCQEQLDPRETIPARMQGELETIVEASPYTL